MSERRAYEHVLALIEFDVLDRSVVERASSLARLCGAALSLLHVIEPDAALDGGYAAASATARADALAQAARRRLEYVAVCAGADAARCHAAQGPRQQILRRELALWRPDLVVMGQPGPCPAGEYDILTLAVAQRRGGRLLPALRAWLSPPLSA
jgi:nucleotide-binding universal stress UspA family protein